MLDHVSLETKDFERAKEFYRAILKVLRFRVWVENSDYIGFGDEIRPYFWLNRSDSRSDVHIAFSAENREAVDEFFRVAIAYGAKDDGAPGLRPEYHKDYYGAFVLDHEGNSVEAVCHKSLEE